MRYAILKQSMHSRRIHRSNKRERIYMKTIIILVLSAAALVSCCQQKQAPPVIQEIIVIPAK